MFGEGELLYIYLLMIHVKTIHWFTKNLMDDVQRFWSSVCMKYTGLCSNNCYKCKGMSSHASGVRVVVCGLFLVFRVAGQTLGTSKDLLKWYKVRPCLGQNVLLPPFP
jgi:hypothetical protein